MKNATTVLDSQPSNFLSFEEFMLKLSAYFSISLHMPDMDVSSFEVNDLIQNHYNTEYEQVISDLGFVDENGDADEEKFVKKIVNYINFNPIQIDSVRFGTMVIEILEKCIPVELF